MIRPVNVPFVGCRDSIFRADRVVECAKVVSFFCFGFFIVYISFPILWENTCLREPLVSGPRLAFFNFCIMLPFIYEPIVTRMTFFVFRRECSRDEDQMQKRVQKNVEKDFKIESPIKKGDWGTLIQKEGAKIQESDERKALQIASEVVISWLTTRKLPEAKSDKKYFCHEVFGYKREMKFDRLCEYVAPSVVKPLFLGEGTVPCFSDPDNKAWKMAYSIGKDLLLRELESAIIFPQLRTSLEEIVTFLYLRALEVTAESLYRHRQQVLEVTSELLNNDCQVKDEMCSILEPLPKRKTSWFNKVCVFRNKSCSMNCMTKLMNKMVSAVGSVGMKKKQEFDIVNTK